VLVEAMNPMRLQEQQGGRGSSDNKGISMKLCVRSCRSGLQRVDSAPLRRGRCRRTPRHPALLTRRKTQHLVFAAAQQRADREWALAERTAPRSTATPAKCGHWQRRHALPVPPVGALCSLKAINITRTLTQQPPLLPLDPAVWAAGAPAILLGIIGAAIPGARMSACLASYVGGAGTRVEQGAGAAAGLAAMAIVNCIIALGIVALLLKHPFTKAV